MADDNNTTPNRHRADPNKRFVRRDKKIEHWHIVAGYMMLYDLVAVNGAYFLSLWLRFDCSVSVIPDDYLQAYLQFIPFYSVFCIAVFWALKLYQSMWRFASFNELKRITFACAITTVFNTVGTIISYLLVPDRQFGRMTISYFVFGAIIQFGLVVAIRFSYRFILLLRYQAYPEEREIPASRVMLIGAGQAGQMILRDLNGAKETHDKVYCIIDDNKNKWKRYIDGVPIVGGREDILKNVEEYKIEKIYVALPSASAIDRREILDICKESGCELKNLPGMYQLVNDEISVNAMTDVSVEDLLGREPIKVNLDEIFAYLTGKVIMVTGGGGSIGSELCRQIAAHKPKQLIIFDVYENNAYEIEQELKRNYGDELNLVTLIGSVRDSRRLEAVFSTYHPDVVYHAAAHKHVPLMETSPREAIKNNAIGTYKTAYMAMKYKAKRFVLISTDKAVNPTNIMGASKRLCEMVVQSFNRMIKSNRLNEVEALHSHVNEDGVVEKLPEGVATEFVAVRFGNVLGSNGSVIPLFKKQIEEGGPVTVTHPDIIRYFMTIQEAVSLVLQAGVYAKGGEIFILDMGEPVKIDTLARNLIKLSGYKPDVDIMVEYTGLRPGEKLYEEKLMEEEGLKTTPNELIHIGKPIAFDETEFLQRLGDLMTAANNETGDIKAMVEEITGTYHPENV